MNELASLISREHGKTHGDARMGAAFGPEGVRFYTRLTTISSRWPKGMKSGADFVMPTMT